TIPPRQGRLGLACMLAHPSPPATRSAGFQAVTNPAQPATFSQHQHDSGSTGCDAHQHTALWRYGAAVTRPVARSTTTYLPKQKTTRPHGGASAVPDHTPPPRGTRGCVVRRALAQD